MTIAGFIVIPAENAATIWNQSKPTSPFWSKILRRRSNEQIMKEEE
jgi:hypothetical protein